MIIVFLFVINYDRVTLVLLFIWENNYERNKQCQCKHLSTVNPSLFAWSSFTRDDVYRFVLAMGKDAKVGGKGKGKQAAGGSDDSGAKGKGKGGKAADGLGTCTYVKGLFCRISLV